MTTELLTDLTIFALAVLVGAMVITASVSSPYAYVLGAAAVAFAAMNVVGGYVVTDRMLHMFRRRPEVRAASAPAVPAARAADHDREKEAAAR